MPNCTPCSESSRTQKFIYRTIWIMKIGPGTWEITGGNDTPPPPIECVTSQTRMGRGLKHNCIPILPHARPHLTLGSGVRWGSRPYFWKPVFWRFVRNRMYLIPYRDKISKYLYYTVQATNLGNCSVFGMHIGVKLNIPILPRPPLPTSLEEQKLGNEKQLHFFEWSEWLLLEMLFSGT